MYLCLAAKIILEKQGDADETPDKRMKKSRRSRVRILDEDDSVADLRPSPLEFDVFLPYACSELECPIVPVVIRQVQEEYVTSKGSEKGKSNRGKKQITARQSKAVLAPGDAKTDTNKKNKDSLSGTQQASPTYSFDDSVHIIVTAVYDTHDHLVEIAFNKSKYPIPRIMIQVLGLCIPFQPYLTKLTIRRGGLNFIVLHEIEKFLSTSVLTEICLDDSPIEEANYYILLDEVTQLRHLSLCRCNINDQVCEMLARRLTQFAPAGECLTLLNLTSNVITDRGAQSISESLRTNRTLRYLNLSGNRITDFGCFAILKVLTEFSLTYDEIVGKRHHLLKYSKDRTITYNQCLEEIINAPLSPSAKSTEGRDKKKGPKGKKLSSATSLKKPRKLLERESSSIKSVTNMGTGTNTLDATAYARAEMLTNELMGPFDDPYSYNDTLCVYGYVHCTGNMALNYLNLAYNNIEYPGLVKILETLTYQSEIVKKDTGLLKIVIEGNYLPELCPEMAAVDYIMERNVTDKNVKQQLSPKKKKK